MTGFSVRWFAQREGADSLARDAVLACDGREVWTPPRRVDAAMLEAFHRHQLGDEGFRPAAGPRASTAPRETLERRGYEAHVGASRWRLGKGDADLIAAPR
ncbi:MAG: hypothetical protein WB816_16895 [Methylocystis sp.]